MNSVIVFVDTILKVNPFILGPHMGSLNRQAESMFFHRCPNSHTRFILSVPPGIVPIEIKAHPVFHAEIGKPQDIKIGFRVPADVFWIFQFLGDGTDDQVGGGTKFNMEYYLVLEKLRRFAEIQNGFIGDPTVGEYIQRASVRIEQRDTAPVDFMHFTVNIVDFDKISDA